MGKLQNINEFNKNRQNLLKVKTSSDQTILLSNDEAKIILEEFVSKDLNLFATGVSNSVKNSLDNKIASKILKFENAMIQHIDNKFNKTTEKIIEMILSSKIEAEVERRVEEKLNKIKKLL